MHRELALIIGVSASLAAFDAANGASPDKPENGLVFEGRAYQLGAMPGDASALIYTEHHQQDGTCTDGRWTPISGSVAYRNKNGSDRARKEIDYAVDLKRPSFILTDSKFDERIEVTNKEDRKAEVIYDEFQNDPVRFEVALGADSIIDAGFDHLVVERWDDLTAGKTIKFDFLAPTRGRLFNFEGVKVSDDRPTEGNVVIRIQPAGFFIGLFADPIHLAYNDQRRLTDYMGLGNMRRENGENHDVHIRYHYNQSHACADWSGSGGH